MQIHSMKKQERRESITIEDKGRKYTYDLVICGSRKLTFRVEYQGHVSPDDSRSWGTSAEELQNIRAMSGLLFWKLLGELNKR